VFQALHIRTAAVYTQTNALDFPILASKKNVSCRFFRISLRTFARETKKKKPRLVRAESQHEGLMRQLIKMPKAFYLAIFEHPNSSVGSPEHVGNLRFLADPIVRGSSQLDRHNPNSSRTSLRIFAKIC
jgi:hypothetical protein